MRSQVSTTADRVAIAVSVNPVRTDIAAAGMLRLYVQHQWLVPTAASARLRPVSACCRVCARIAWTPGRGRRPGRGQSGARREVGPILQELQHGDLVAS